MLRHLDCVLASTKAAVLAEKVKREAMGANPHPFLLRAAKLRFVNTSPLDLKKLMGNQDNLATNLMSYVQAFTDSVRDAFERFRFVEQVDRLRKAGLLYQVTEKFAGFDLDPKRITNHDMGLAFEELIRKFAEASNETAGEHFTPRDAIKLMVNLLFIEDDEILTPGNPVVRTIYDPSAGTVGMLSVATDDDPGVAPEPIPMHDVQAGFPTVDTGGISDTMCKATIVALLPFLVADDAFVEMMRALRARGYDVAIAVCSNKNDGNPVDPMEDFAAEGRLIDLRALHPEHYKDRLQYEFAARGTRLVLQVGANSAYPALPYLKVANPNLKLIDIVYDEVGHALSQFQHEHCFDSVIVESNYMRRFVVCRNPRQSGIIRIIEGGVDLNYFTLAERVSRPGRLQFGYIGRMSTGKNPIGFIELAERIAAQLPGIRFSIVGDGSLSEDVQRRIMSSPMQDRIVYHEGNPDIRNAIQSLDVLAVPSICDARPNIIMEASACGVPVIGSPGGGIPGLIGEGQNGFLAFPREVDRVADILRALLNDYSAPLTAMRQTCRSLAKARFDRNRTLDDYVATFEDFVGT